MRHVKKEKSKTQKNRQISILSKKYYEKKAFWCDLTRINYSKLKIINTVQNIACIPLKNAKIKLKNTRKEKQNDENNPQETEIITKKKLEKLGFAVALKKFQKW